MKPAMIFLSCIACAALGSLATAATLAYRASQPLACELNCTEITKQSLIDEVLK
jgi:hypothetical protein